MHRRTRTLGITLTETLLATVLLLAVVTAFAQINAQAARTVSNSELSVYASDALANVSRAINEGNPAYTRDTNLSAEDIQLLASTGTHRAVLRPALSGHITPINGSDPPTYRIAIGSSDFEMDATAIGPGGSE